MITEFDNFILEKCISDVIIKYTDIIYYEILEHIKNKINDDLIFNLDNANLPLMNLFIDYKLTNKNYGLFDTTNIFIKDNILYNVRIDLQIDNNFNTIKIKEIITHELNHILEYYKIKSKNLLLKIDIERNPNYISVRKSINSVNFNENELNYFKYLIYLSLDTEYNARIAQLFQYLSAFNTKDKNELLQKLDDSETFKVYNYLSTFNPNKIINDLYNKIGKEATINELNKLNTEFLNNGLCKLNGYKFIKIINETNILEYLNKWEKLFKIKNTKHKEKMNAVIDKIIKEGYETFKDITFGDIEMIK
jgi:hypothetical protein